MNKLKIIQQIQKQNSVNQGFTLVEVLVGILIVSAFTIGTMQSLALSAYFRVKGQQYSQASSKISEDLEAVKFWANQYYPTTTHSTLCAAKTPAAGYAENLKTYVNTRVPATANITITGRSFPMTRTLQVYDNTFGATAPYNILKVFYEVRDPQITNPSNATIAYFQSEVIPGGVFSCPSF